MAKTKRKTKKRTTISKSSDEQETLGRLFMSSSDSDTTEFPVPVLDKTSTVEVHSKPPLTPSARARDGIPQSGPRIDLGGESWLLPRGTFRIVTQPGCLVKCGICRRQYGWTDRDPSKPDCMEPGCTETPTEDEIKAGRRQPIGGRHPVFEDKTITEVALGLYRDITNSGVAGWNEMFYFVSICLKAHYDVDDDDVSKLLTCDDAEGKREETLLRQVYNLVHLGGDGEGEGQKKTGTTGSN